MRLFSLLRRSLCALLVAVTAFSSYADLSSPQLQNLLNSINAVYDVIVSTQNNSGKSTAWYLQNIRDILRDTIAPIGDSVASNTTAVSGLSDDLSSILSELSSISDALSSGGYDDSLQTSLAALLSSLESISTNLTSIDLGVTHLDTTTFPSGVVEIVSAIDQLPTVEDLSTLMGDIVASLDDLQRRLDNDLTVSGEVNISGSSLTLLSNKVGRIGEELDSFFLYFKGWLGIQGDPPSGQTFGSLCSSAERIMYNTQFSFEVLQQIYARLAYINDFTDYLQDTYPKYNDFYTNALAAYLPFLTNQTDDLFYPFFTNELAHTPLFPGSPSWSYDPNAYILGRMFGIVLGQNYGFNGSQPEGRTSLFQVPGQSKNFWATGQFGPTALESKLYAWSEPSMTQRRWMYEISNTVPYIEGLPTRSAALSESGSGWLSAWGDLQWNTENGELTLLRDERLRAHTPWNHGYFSTDYFADLLKFIASTNLLQNAYYGEKLLEAMGQTNVIADIEDLPQMPELQPVTNVVDDMTPQNLFPSISDVDVQEMEVDQLSSFESDARSKISTALTISGTSSGSIVLFPALPFLNNENLSSEYRFDFADHFDSQDRELVRTIFSAIWHIIFYVFAVFKVCTTIQQFFTAS